MNRPPCRPVHFCSITCASFQMIEKDNNEHTLLQLLLAKDQTAWKKLFERYAGSLASVCSRYLASKDDIHDVLQESFIRIFNSIHLFEYRGEGSLKAWMARITINESLKVIKKTADEPALMQPDYLPDICDNDDDDDENITLPKILPETVLEIIKSLPAGYRTVFNLFVFEKKTHHEIAGIMGIAENSSASQLHRAKKMVAAKIKELEKQNTVSNGR